MKKIKIFILFVLSIVTVYASSTIARDRYIATGGVLPWQGTADGHFDLVHNVGENYNADNSRFSFVNGSSKGPNTYVYDSKTKLTWQSTPSTTQKTWAEAMSSCNLLGDGWRLPTIDELITIVDYTRNNPSVNTDFFTLIYGNYLSSTMYASDANNVWIMHIDNGSDDWFNKNRVNYFICVR